LLKNTFLHIPGIGIQTEQRLWASGIQSWDDVTEDRAGGLSPKKRQTVVEHLLESTEHLDSIDPNYFFELSPASHHWRFFPEFRDATVYLDIETTGLSRYTETITTIALYNGESISYYVKGRNLDDFPEDIEKYKVIVTYNGKSFDLPFIERYFGITLNHAHIDLRYVLASLGYRGGLKGCETRLGFHREDLADIDGYFAVLLWQDYRKNRNIKALETLLAYNIQDVLSLEILMVMAYNLKIADTPFYLNRLPDPVLPELPFHADINTVARIRSGQNYFALR